MPERTQQEIIQDQVAEKAKYAAAVAAASGNVVKQSFMATVTGAKTFGERAVVFGALAGFVAFFLPWVSFLGTVSASGLRCALDASWVFWLHPFSMIVVFVTSAFLRDADTKKRILASRWFVVIGTLWFGPGLAAVCNVFSGVIGFGGYLATASAGAILLGGILQISGGLNKLSEAV